MKYKYLLFGYDNHGACGGMEDLIGKFNTFNEFEDFIYTEYEDYQLVDVENFIVKEFSTKINMDWYKVKDIREQRKTEFINWVEDQLL